MAISIINLAREDYYLIPKPIMVGKDYTGLSLKAKMLYGLLLGEAEVNDSGVYEVTQVSREEMAAVLVMGLSTVFRLFKELKSYGLLEEERQGLGKTNRIFLREVS